MEGSLLDGTHEYGEEPGPLSCAQVFWGLYWPYWLVMPVNELKV